MTLLESAIEIFKQLAVPKGLMADLKLADFEAVYNGNGSDTSENPVQLIFPKADALALFAVTLGAPLTERASGLFAQGGPALGYMLEAVTTAGAERLGNLMSQRFLEHLSEERPRDLTVLHYSPGNCGWHLSSQEKIFHYLHPEEIGIGLSSSFHMRPQKSLSGVLIAGPKEIHLFKPNFQLCLQCKTHKCAQRFARLQPSTVPGAHA
jgi:cobalamin-dependent methionine synthase I